jgi:hypothetical protein
MKRDDASSTVPAPSPANKYCSGPQPPGRQTPCGYPAGPIMGSDGTVYQVLDTGQTARRKLRVRAEGCATKRG